MSVNTMNHLQVANCYSIIIVAEVSIPYILSVSEMFRSVEVCAKITIPSFSHSEVDITVTLATRDISGMHTCLLSF